MTAPRAVYVGDVVAITRRTLERTEFMRPDPQFVQLSGYLLGVALAKYDMGLVAACFMRTHYHLQLIDRHGQHPRFTAWLDSMLARATNALRQRRDRFWDGNQPNVLRLVDDGARLDNAAYVLANPVAAIGAAHGRDWPGLRTTPQACLQPPRRYERPSFFFAADSELPPAVDVPVVAPPTEAKLAASEWAGRLADHVAALEDHHRQQAARDGKTFPSRRALQRRSWRNRATSPEPFGAAEKIIPHVKASDPTRRIEALELRQQFIARYRAARESFLAAGRRILPFPTGTWDVPNRFGRRFVPT